MNQDEEKRIDKILQEDADLLEDLGKEKKVGRIIYTDNELEEIKSVT